MLSFNKLVFMLVLGAVCVCGCQKKTQLLDIQKKVINNKTDVLETDVTYSEFSFSDPKINASCKVLNTEIQRYVLRLQDSIKTDAQNLFKDLEKNRIARPSWTYSLFVTDSIFIATDRYISLRLCVYTFTGGAHGLTKFYAFNYDVRKQKMLSDADIIDYARSARINRSLKAHFENFDDCFSSDPTLDQISAINFSPKAFCFTYAQYQLGAYVCGTPEVSIPLKEIKSSVLLPL